MVEVVPRHTAAVVGVMVGIGATVTVNKRTAEQPVVVFNTVRLPL